jgi:hypothetical protein
MKTRNRINIQREKDRERKTERERERERDGENRFSALFVQQAGMIINGCNVYRLGV